MAYQVKEIYYTLQGEGAQAGRPAVFCRFAGCNLWSGRESDRQGAACWFCDTDFVGTDGARGAKYRTEAELADSIEECWNEYSSGPPFVVFTGGEPLLQLDESLLSALKNKGFEIAVETNGTIEAPAGLDWITVSPKAGTELMQRAGNELKLVFPQGVAPEHYADLPFAHFFLSPRWSAESAELRHHTELAMSYCRANPKWKLTMQYHKIWGIP